MGLETLALVLGGLTLGAGGAFGAKAIADNNNRSNRSSQPQQTQNDIGNLTEDEASASASKKLFRQGIFATSPTGLQTGSRGRSRLMGS